jgi:general stress protein YciG
MMQALQELSKAEAIVIEISEVIDSSQRVTKVTEKGEKILKDIKPMEERFEIRYVYGLRSGAGSSLVIPTTRKFCSDLCDVTAGEKGGKKTGGQLGGNMTWDLEEIVNMGVKADRNVWQRGGGFWGNSYHCRHEWKQVIVKEKR